ncbi:MAG: hypothetical protein ACPGSL_07790 [Vicingaceae bacterium]
MDFETSKIELAKMVLNLESKYIVSKLTALIKSEQSDFLDSLSPQEKAEIHLGLNQLNTGEKISFDDFLKKVS